MNNKTRPSFIDDQAALKTAQEHVLANLVVLVRRFAAAYNARVDKDKPEERINFAIPNLSNAYWDVVTKRLVHAAHYVMTAPVEEKLEEQEAYTQFLNKEITDIFASSGAKGQVLNNTLHSQAMQEQIEAFSGVMFERLRTINILNNIRTSISTPSIGGRG